jgi:hypothetical protein
MATWFAQNSSVNTDSVNQWNSATNGSGSWLTWASLGASDILVANGKTSIAINVNVMCATLTTAATGGTAGGGFILSAGVNITANIECGTTTCVTRSAAGGSNCTITGNLTGSTTTGSVSAYVHSSSGTTNIVGNITGGTSGGFGASVSNGVVNVTGNVTGGGAGNLCHGISYSVGSLAITGNVTGGTQIYSYGINASATLSLVIIGDIIPSATTPAIGLVGTGSGTTTILHTGNIQGSSAGIVPFGGSHKYLIHATNAQQHGYYTSVSGTPGVLRTLYTGGVNIGLPAIANVRLGTAYGAVSEYTGTLAVPSPTLVAIGVATDNTVGSYAPSGASAADVADAVWDEARSGHTTAGTFGKTSEWVASGDTAGVTELLTRIPDAAPGTEGGLPVLSADLTVAVELDSTIQTQLNAIEDGVDGANGYLATLVSRITSSAAALFVNLAAMITGSGGTSKFTTLALEDAPGSGESGTDWTPEERAEIRYRLAMSGTATAPPEPDVDPIVITPATGIMTTGWLVTRVKGVPTADITIRYRQGLEPNGGTGSSYDSDTHEAKSNSEGIAELSLVKGGQYYIWRGFGQKPANADLIAVPSDAATTYALPSHVGD